MLIPLVLTYVFDDKSSKNNTILRGTYGQIFFTKFKLKIL